MCSQKVSSARRSHVTEQRERTGEEAQERGVTEGNYAQELNT